MESVDVHTGKSHVIDRAPLLLQNLSQLLALRRLASSIKALDDDESSTGAWNHCIGYRKVDYMRSVND